MNSKKVLYKEIEYTVYNPGRIMECKNFINQLDENLVEINKRWKERYINKKYNLSLEEYYIIVVFLGDESLIPKCKCRRCNNVTKFCNRTMSYKDFCGRSCVATETNLRGMENKTNKWIITNRENWENPFKGEKGSKLSRNVQNRSVKEGRHPWMGEKGSNTQKERLRNGSHPFLKRETEIKGAKRLFELKGSPDDICYFYIAKENKNKGVIKIGITSNINRKENKKRSNT